MIRPLINTAHAFHSNTTHHQRYACVHANAHARTPPPPPVAQELPLLSSMEPWFLPHYTRITARKLLFFHGKRRKRDGELRVRSAVGSLLVCEGLGGWGCSWTHATPFLHLTIFARAKTLPQQPNHRHTATHRRRTTSPSPPKGCRICWSVR